MVTEVGTEPAAKGEPAMGVNVPDARSIVYAETLPEGDGYFSLSLIGSAGAAYADDHHNTQLLYAGGHAAALKTGESEFEELAQLQEFVNAIEGISFIYFDERDVVRHKLVQQIVKAYEAFTNGNGRHA